MQSTSATWRSLWAAGATLEAAVEIGGAPVELAASPVIRRGLMSGGLSVGNAVSAACALTLRTDAAIPKSAEVKVKLRLTDGETASEWLPAGTFYISRRSKDGVTGKLSLECYDALLKANAAWTPQGEDWPRPMAAVAAELAGLLGLELDSRTVLPTGGGSVIARPEAGTTIRDALSAIGARGGGNWIVTPANRLRLVPVASYGGAVRAEGVLGGIEAGAAGTVTGLRCAVDGESTLIGDETGFVVGVNLAPVLAAELAEDLIGMTWQPFSLRRAVYDPAAELGDRLTGGAEGEIDGMLCAETATLGPAFRGDVSAPEPEELADEYPYIGAGAQALRVLRAAVAELEASAILGVDVEYALGESASEAPETGWASDPPQWRAGFYIWSRTATTTAAGTAYSEPACLGGRDGRDGEDGAPGQDGAPGRDGTSVTVSRIEYAAGSSGTAAPSSGWQSGVPSVAPGRWLWVRTVYSDGTAAASCSYMGNDGEDGRSVAIQSVSKVGDTTTVRLTDSDGSTKTLTIVDGEDGDDGAPGAAGYVHVAWADSADGRTNFSTSDSAGRSYLGVYTDNAAADSTNPAAYSWSRIEGEQGQRGATGVGVSAVTEQYYLSTSSATQTGGSWSAAQPQWASGRYIWTRSVVTWTDGSVTTTTPVLAKAINGANQAASDAAGAVDALDDSLTQRELFNRLTGNGAAQGIVLANGQLYINATYIQTGLITDATGANQWNLGTGVLTTGKGAIGDFTLDNGALTYAGGAASAYIGKDGLYFTQSDGTTTRVGLDGSHLTFTNGGSVAGRVYVRSDAATGDRTLYINLGHDTETGGYAIRIVNGGGSRDDVIRLFYPVEAMDTLSVTNDVTCGTLWAGSVVTPSVSGDTQWLGRPVGVAYGGTGAATAAAARENLGLGVREVGSVTSVAALNTALKAVYDTMSNFTSVKIHFTMNGATGVFHSAHYMGELTRLATGTAAVNACDAYGSAVMGRTSAIASGFSWQSYQMA